MNMSYCRFTNTLQDLKDCYYNIENVEDMSDDELIARKKLIEICVEIADNADYLLNIESEAK